MKGQASVVIGAGKVLFILETVKRLTENYFDIGNDGQTR